MAPGDGPGPGGRLWVWRSEVGSLTSKEKRQQHRGRGDTWAKRNRKHSLAKQGGEVLQLKL